MADVVLSPNMGLPVPSVGIDPGPDWANNLNASLSIIDGHTHIPGSGVQITPAGININADLAFQTNNATMLRSSRYTPQVSPISAVTPDLGCVYVAGVDLYYNDSNGNSIQITKGGSVNSSAGNISGLPSTPVGGAGVAWQNSLSTFQFTQDSGSAGANIDVGSIIIRYPGSYPSPAGNFIALEAPSSLASGYALTLPGLPAADNTFLTISTAGVISSSLTVDGSTLNISSNHVQVAPGGITITQMAANSVGTSQLVNGSVTRVKQAAVGQQVSSSSGSFSSSSTSFVNVTNLSISITTTGRPVVLAMVSDGSGNACSVTTAGQVFVSIRLLRGATEVSRLAVGTVAGGNQELYGPGILAIDAPSANTYTYSVQALSSNGVAFGISRYVLVAYEL